MVRGICPDCGALVEITPTGETIAMNWTAKYWRVVMHVAPKDGPCRGMICDGSGKKI